MLSWEDSLRASLILKNSALFLGSCIWILGVSLSLISSLWDFGVLLLDFGPSSKILCVASIWIYPNLFGIIYVVRDGSISLTDNCSKSRFWGPFIFWMLEWSWVPLNEVWFISWEVYWILWRLKLMFDLVLGWCSRCWSIDEWRISSWLNPLGRWPLLMLRSYTLNLPFCETIY